MDATYAERASIIMSNLRFSACAVRGFPDQPGYCRGVTVTFHDSTLNTANLCPAISVVGLFYLFTVMFTFVVDIESYG